MVNLKSLHSFVNSQMKNPSATKQIVHLKSIHNLTNGKFKIHGQQKQMVNLKSMHNLANDKLKKPFTNKTHATKHWMGQGFLWITNTVQEKNGFM